MKFYTAILPNSTKWALFTLLFVCLSNTTFPQATYISGSVFDNKEPIPGVTVVALRGEYFSGGARTDMNGYYKMKLDSGMFNIEVYHAGYQTQRISNIHVQMDKPNLLPDILMLNRSIPEAIISVYKVPLIDQNDPNSAYYLPRELRKRLREQKKNAN